MKKFIVLKPMYSNIGKLIPLTIATALLQQTYALPQTGDVQSGIVDFETTTVDEVNTLDVNQSTQQAIVNWDSFNVGSNDVVNFNYSLRAPGSILNRVAGNDASSILGTINGSDNLNIMLLNQNGIVFGSDSQVNVSSLTASTLTLTDQNFLDANYAFSTNDSYGSILNEGTFNLQDGGMLAFIAPVINNQANSTINASDGTVIMAAANEFTLDLTGDNLISYQISGDYLSNRGVINAQGGRVYLSARNVGELAEQVINVNGFNEAIALDQQDGEIYLIGSIDVSNNSESGGSVYIAGKDIESHADIDTTGSVANGDVNYYADGVAAVNTASLTGDVTITGNQVSVASITGADSISLETVGEDSVATISSLGEQNNHIAEVNIAGFDFIRLNNNHVDTVNLNAAETSQLYLSQALTDIGNITGDANTVILKGADGFYGSRNSSSGLLSDGVSLTRAGGELQFVAESNFDQDLNVNKNIHLSVVEYVSDSNYQKTNALPVLMNNINVEQALSVEGYYLAKGDNSNDADFYNILLNDQGFMDKYNNGELTSSESFFNYAIDNNLFSSDGHISIAGSDNSTVNIHGEFHAASIQLGDAVLTDDLELVASNSINLNTISSNNEELLLSSPTVDLHGSVNSSELHFNNIDTIKIYDTLGQTTGTADNVYIMDDSASIIKGLELTKQHGQFYVSSGDYHEDITIDKALTFSTINDGDVNIDSLTANADVNWEADHINFEQQLILNGEMQGDITDSEINNLSGKDAAKAVHLGDEFVESSDFTVNNYQLPIVEQSQPPVTTPVVEPELPTPEATQRQTPSSEELVNLSSKKQDEGDDTEKVNKNISIDLSKVTTEMEDMSVCVLSGGNCLDL